MLFLAVMNEFVHIAVADQNLVYIMAILSSHFANFCGPKQVLININIKLPTTKLIPRICTTIAQQLYACQAISNQRCHSTRKIYVGFFTSWNDKRLELRAFPRNVEFCFIVSDRGRAYTFRALSERVRPSQCVYSRYGTHCLLCTHVRITILFCAFAMWVFYAH